MSSINTLKDHCIFLKLTSSKGNYCMVQPLTYLSKIGTEARNCKSWINNYLNTDSSTVLLLTHYFYLIPYDLRYLVSDYLSVYDTLMKHAFSQSCYGTVTLGEKKMEAHNTLHYSLVRRSVTYWKGQRLLCLECYAVSIPETPVIGWQMFGCDKRIQPNHHLEVVFVWTTHNIGVPKSNTTLLTCTVRINVYSPCLCRGTHAVHNAQSSIIIT
jgi:hypothetical protein